LAGRLRLEAWRLPVRLSPVWSLVGTLGPREYARGLTGEFDRPAEQASAAMTTRVAHVSPLPEVVDAAIDAYVQWREESADAREAYCRWSSAATTDRMLASGAYLAALDREEAAASVYADAMRRLGDECVDVFRPLPQLASRGPSSRRPG
jgi:hypothetical protein